MSLVNNSIVNDSVVNGETISGGTLLSISKEIIESKSGSGSLIKIQKNIIKDYPAHTLLAISKIISNPLVAPSFYEKFGYKPIIILGGVVVSDDAITESLTVTRSESDNSTAVFTLKLSTGVYNLYDYQGQSVIINIQKNGNIYRRFTGIVNIPIVNALLNRITLNCVADRRTLLSQYASVEPYIGVYSDTVFGTSDDVVTRINNRLTTVSASFDFDSYNQAILMDWLPKSTADFVFDSDEIYRRNALQIQFESSANLINTVNIKVEYGYQRLHHREASFIWGHDYGGSGICKFLEDRPSMPTRDSIVGAANGAGWPIKPGTMGFTEQFKSGSYNCGGFWVQWSTVESASVNIAATNADGSLAKDAAGNQLYRNVTKILADNTNVFCLGAGWVASTRFNQNIKEVYNCQLVAQNSVARYGTLQTTLNMATTDDNNYESWEDYKAYQYKPNNAVVINAGDVGSYAINGDQDRARFNNAFNVVLSQAKATILKSHRDTRITFQKPLDVFLELYHTVQLTGRWVKAKGKCVRINDVIQISGDQAGASYTEVTIAQYRSTGSNIDSPLVLPASPTNNFIPKQSTVALGCHIGIDPKSPGSELWNGYVGNKQVKERVVVQNPNGTGSRNVLNTKRTEYQESFTVDVPAISNDLREDKIFYQSASYSVNIPQDNTLYVAEEGPLGE